MIIRPEQERDFSGIRKLHQEAFKGNIEADLVDELRKSPDFVPSLSLVALEGNLIVGHILLTPIEMDVDGKACRTLALAPMAVTPKKQKQGIGSVLIREGLARARKDGYQVVLVMGHRDYYPLFGFSAELAEKVTSEFSGPHLMALELTPGVLAEAKKAEARYPEAFEAAK